MKAVALTLLLQLPFLGLARAQAEEPHRPTRGWAIGTGAVAVAALIAGSIVGGLALSRSNEQNGNPAAPPLYTAETRNRGQQGASMEIASGALLGLGGALAVIDVGLWIELLRKPRSPTSSLASLKGKRTGGTP